MDPATQTPEEELEQLRMELPQLRRDSNMERMPVSETINDIMNYCNDHVSKDPFITGFRKSSDNPFKEKTRCTIL